ncbi:transglutaminase-like domain-containing protein [Albimonas pacifica]|uniref:Transglutaminase-like enzyme, putative cysteine protease n=1 Tax=Albimonas pacifica TaxID=1114924 RepID=A0A1I3GC62_9RHOB|nr:transglutaminase family protein [Albimonas pacifica]SFI21043.1 Transglutaminase-like enzyme, putative cysteine protease [Albimonas pacifica]
MRLRLGCEIASDFQAPTPIVAMLNVHHSRVSCLERPDHLTVSPPVPIDHYRDSFGNWCARMVAPAGRFSLRTDGIIRDDGAPDPVFPDARQAAIEDLPSDTIQFLLPSRYCESDKLMEEAWNRFGHLPEGWARVQGVVEYVHHHIVFDYMAARNTRTAFEANQERTGVCRDFAHLAVAFCRALNVPTRYCTGYVSDIGQPPPYAPMDFAAWMEVFLDGRWMTFDPRNLTPRRGRVLVGRGRDAADVPLTHSFGFAQLAKFEVWIDEAPDAA